MYCVCILYSEKINRFYTGYTGYTANLSGRLEFHSNAVIRKYTYRASNLVYKNLAVKRNITLADSK